MSVGREEIRRALRAVQDPQRPIIRKWEDQILGERPAGRVAFVALAPARAKMQDVARAQRASRVAAEKTQRERRAAAEIGGYVESAAHGEIGAASGTCDRTQTQCGPTRDLGRTVRRKPCPVDRRAHIGPRQRDGRRGSESQRGPHHRAFQARGFRQVSDQAIAQAERQGVHRARRGNPHIPVPESPRKVLHRRLGSGLDDIDGGLGTREAFEQARVDFPGAKSLGGENVDQIGAVGFDAVDARGRERLPQAYRSPLRASRRAQSPSRSGGRSTA